MALITLISLMAVKIYQSDSHALQMKNSLKKKLQLSDFQGKIATNYMKCLEQFSLVLNCILRIIESYV